MTLAPLAAFDDTAARAFDHAVLERHRYVAYYRGLQVPVLVQPNTVCPCRILRSISKVSSLFHAGRHLRHRHQWLRHLIEQLASILLFSQRGREELDQQRLANLKR